MGKGFDQCGPGGREGGNEECENKLKFKHYHLWFTQGTIVEFVLPVKGKLNNWFIMIYKITITQADKLQNTARNFDEEDRWLDCWLVTAIRVSSVEIK